MQVEDILSELKHERERIEQAISALESLNSAKAGVGRKRGRKPGRHMSEDARRRIGVAMKKRWAEKRKADKKAA